MTTRQRRRVALAFSNLIIAAAMAFTLSPPASANNTPTNVPPLVRYYGAIAYSPDGSSGMALRRKVRLTAHRDALSACGVSTCTVVSSFHRCGAVAHDGDRYHGGHGLSIGHAESHAISMLGGGWIVKSVCH